MTKLKFLLALHDRLSALPQSDVEERLSFYSEMIEDRMEEGLPEEAAVLAVGTVDEIAAQIIGDITSTKQPKPKRRLKVWEIVLLALGAPIWLSLLIAGFAVVLSLYAVLWSVIISLWAAFGSVIGCAIGGIAAGIGFACNGNGLTGIAMLGASVFCSGLSIFLFLASKAATKGTLLLTKSIALWIRNCFVKKEEAQ